MRYFIINTKNYEECKGDALFELASAAKKASKTIQGVQLSLAVPAFSIQSLSKAFPDIDVIAQHLDDSPVGSTTGFLVPEIAQSFGAKGSLLNHSEHRIPSTQLSKTVRRLRNLGLQSIACAKTPAEVQRIARLIPDFVAIEPPELIGSGVSVSRAKPSLITRSRAALEKSFGKDRTNKIPILLCGAGIVNADDVAKAVELGSSGILVASGVVKSKDWEWTIGSMARALIGG